MFRYYLSDKSKKEVMSFEGFKIYKEIKKNKFFKTKQSKLQKYCDSKVINIQWIAINGQIMEDTGGKAKATDNAYMNYNFDRESLKREKKGITINNIEEEKKKEPPVKKRRGRKKKTETIKKEDVKDAE